MEGTPGSVSPTRTETNKDGRAPRSSDITRKFKSATREVTGGWLGKPYRERTAKNGEREHHTRNSPRRRTTQSRKDTAKTWEHRQKEGQDSCTVSRIQATRGTIAKLITEYSSQGHIRALPPHEEARGLKRHLEENLMRSELQVQCRAHRASRKKKHYHSSNDPVMGEMSPARTKGPDNFNNCAPKGIPDVTNTGP